MVVVVVLCPSLLLLLLVFVVVVSLLPSSQLSHRFIAGAAPSTAANLGTTPLCRAGPPGRWWARPRVRHPWNWPTCLCAGTTNVVSANRRRPGVGSSLIEEAGSHQGPSNRFLGSR